MKQYTEREIDAAAQDDDGFCLACHTQQSVTERRLLLGLCEHCGEYEVVSGELVAATLQLVNMEGD